MTTSVRSLLLSGLVLGGSLGGGLAREPVHQGTTPWRIAPELTACFCPATHVQTVLASGAQLDGLIASAPCTSRGDGAEARARAWGERCRRAVADASLELETHALVYVARFYSSGMIRGSLEVSGPESGVLTLELRRHQPAGPLTPDLGFFASALVVDKALIRQVRIVDSTGAVVALPVTPDADAPADLVITGGAVWTGVPGAPLAAAVAVRGERIAAVGTGEEIGRLIGPATRVVDARGGLVVPGFIDTHVHFIDGGFRLASVQLRDAATPHEFSARIAAFARTVPAGTWITGGDWDHQNWGGELPRREWIDSITPHHPVWINRLDGHMALANSAALAAAGVTRATAEVAGGEIVRDASGEPTGLLKDNAMALVARVEPEPGPEQRDRALAAAMRYVAEQGVTAVHNMGSWSDLATFERAHRAGRLRTRIYAAVPLASWAQLRDTLAARNGASGDEWLRIGALKGFVDGSLGSKTAAFHEPFTDAPGNTGLLVNTPEALYGWISGADGAGLHVMVHAIGDRANNLLLDIFERVARENGPRADRRFRIEHAQHIAPADIPRFRALGIIPSMQPYHAIDDGRWADRVIGPERSRTTYAFRDLLDAGASLAFGSDWFVAPPTPLEGIYAAVTRFTLDGAHPNGWVPEQRITVEEALVAYTRDAAFASFDEHARGTLETGRLADIVVLDRNLLTIPPATIRDAQVVLTVVGGIVVWERPGSN